ncbi:MAG TPA: tetratricopeptide repeat protein, partial [Steroidobacteraceae bacterium]|nr:tetratricopeptide repeat protein [Steroidobacteraceae bacterium]
MYAVRRPRAFALRPARSVACDLLLPLTALASIGANAAQPCRDQERATVRRDAPWRCEVELQPRRSYLVTVDQASVDVTVEVLDRAGRSLAKVDSPTRRAGPELLLVSPQVPGMHTVIVAASSRGNARVAVSTAADSAIPGLASLTAAAAVKASPTPQDMERHLTTLREAAAKFRAARAAAYEAETLLRIAALDCWIRLNWSDGARSAQVAMTAFEGVGDEVMWSQAAVIRAASLIEIAYETRGARNRGASSAVSDFAEAERLLTRAAGTFRAAAMRYDEAHAINNLGIAHFYQGRNDEARDEYLASARIFRAEGELTSEILPLQNLAVLDFDRGDYARAAESYAKLLPRLAPDHDPLDRVALLNNLAVAQDVLGNTDEALQAYMSALAITERQGYVADRARTLHGLGNLYVRLGESERGGQFLQQALALRRSMQPPDRRGLYASLLWVGEWHRERGESAQALQLHVQASDHAVSTAQKARTLLAIGRDHMQAGSLAQALAAFERGLALELPEDWPVRASLRSAYGSAKLRSGDPVGYALIAAAAAAHDVHGNDELAAQDYLLLAQEDLRAERIQEASRNVGRALELFEAQRAGAMNPDLRASYLGSRSAAYELQAEIYML